MYCSVDGLHYGEILGKKNPLLWGERDMPNGICQRGYIGCSKRNSSDGAINFTWAGFF